MATDETAVFDPAEFIPNRKELDLEALGLKVVDIDWGDAQQELFMIKKAKGEIRADAKYPNRKVTMKLQARKDAAKGRSMADNLYDLQRKIGTLQRKTGWVRRDMNSVQGFKVSVGAIVYGADIAGIQGWFMSHRGIAKDIVVTLTCSPFFYGTEEFTSAIVKTETDRFVEYTHENQFGTIDGLSRIRAKNLSSEVAWSALIWAEECDDAPEELGDPLAKLRYKSTELTARGESVSVGGGWLANFTLTTGWKTVLYSEVPEVGHLHHKGVRRIWIRFEKPGFGEKNIQIRLVWRTLGSSHWNEDNEIITIQAQSGEGAGPSNGHAQLYDVGEIRPEPAVIGDDRIEFKILAALSGAGTDPDLYMENIYMLPTEQYAVVTEPSGDIFYDEIVGGGSVVTVEEINWPGATSTRTWSNPNNVKVEDGSLASVDIPFALKAEELRSKVLKLTNFGITGIPAGATITGVSLYAKGASYYITNGNLAQIYGWVVKGGKVESSYQIGNNSAPYNGGPTPEWFQILSTAYPEQKTKMPVALTAEDIESSGFGIALGVEFGFTPFISESAHTYFYCDQIKLIIYYVEPGNDPRVCYVERSVEIQTNGVYRQHPSEDVWGEIVPEGDYPYATPPGLEDKPSRGILIPTDGDLVTTNDDDENLAIEAKRMIRPAYHFASEAE